MERIYLEEDKIKKFKFWNNYNEVVPTNFIGSWDIKNEKLCKRIINFFEENESLQLTGSVTDIPDKIGKKTTDITISPNNLKDIKFKYLNEYIYQLHKCFIDYLDQWPLLKTVFDKMHVGSFKIQKYSANDHFPRIHTGRASLKSSHKVFAWMTYLNDVNDGGATNFSHYDIKIKPETGKTLIWPAEWTHAHSDESVKSGVKYIVKGWIHFPPSDEIS